MREAAATMKYDEACLPRPRSGGGRRSLWIACIALCSCSATFALGVWSGRNTITLSIDQATRIIEDPEQPQNRKQLATTQLFRLAENGNEARVTLEKIAQSRGCCAEQARRYLTKLTR